MHRAYHAVQTPMTAKDGTPTNAVFGFLTMLCKFIEMASPDAVVCAFDAGKPVHRIEAMAQYKAQRPPMDEELHVQFPVIQELLESMAIPVVKVPGWEGDDILGTIAARDEALGYETLLVTGDKDAYQLASELTRIVTTKKGITDVTINGPAEVEERYGVTPAQFIDYLGLMGDSSDNIPGVPGVGDKTAAKLLGAYGSLEGIYEHIDELRGKQKERMEENRDAAFTSRKVATIVRDLDFPLDLEGAAFPAFSAQAVTEAFSKYRFNAHLTRVLKLVGEAPERASAAIEVGRVLHGEEAEKLVDAVLESGEQVGVAIVDPEQESLFGGGSVVAVSASQGCAVFTDDVAFSQLARLVAGGNFAAIDVKAAVHRVYPADNALPALVDDGQLMSMRAFALGLAGYVLNSSVSEYTYDVLLDSYMGGVLSVAKTEEQRATAQAAAARALRVHDPVEEEAAGGAGVFAALQYVALCKPALRGYFLNELLVVVGPAEPLGRLPGYRPAAAAELPAHGYDPYAHFRTSILIAPQGRWGFPPLHYSTAPAAAQIFFTTGKGTARGRPPFFHPTVP